MQEEKYGTRNIVYSAWHRRKSTMRFVGLEKAQLLGMIDLDASLYVEYGESNKVPVALIETAMDVGQPYKSGTVTRNLSKMAGIPSFVVLYELSSDNNPADNTQKDIASFRIRKLHPPTRGYTGGWIKTTPQKYADFLVRLRSETISDIEKILPGFDI